MTLPSEGMQIFPVVLWNGITTEVVDPGAFTPAGPVTTRKLIDEVLGLENYLSKKIVTLPDFDTDLSLPTSYDSVTFEITGNCAKITFANLLNEGESPPVRLVYHVDLNRYFPPGVDTLYAEAVDFYTGTPVLASLTYDRVEQLLTYVNYTTAAGDAITNTFLMV